MASTTVAPVGSTLPYALTRPLRRPRVQRTVDSAGRLIIRRLNAWAAHTSRLLDDQGGADHPTSLRSTSPHLLGQAHAVELGDISEQDFVHAA